MESFTPLNSIRVFAVVGRLLSFSQAAKELGVTPSAVSHQIRSLEDYLGVILLRRERNRVTLTPAGRNYLNEITEGFTQVSRATRVLKAAKGKRVIRLYAPVSLCSLWLIPRLALYAKAHPDVALSVTSSFPPALPALGQNDLAIYYDVAPPAGLRGDALSTNELLPVCSPKLTAGRHPLRAVSNLRFHTLIESTDDIYYDVANPGWQGWLRAAMVPDTTSARYLNFTPMSLMHDAIVAGLGIGLTRTLLAVDAILAGQLVVPFGPVLSLRSYYYLLSPNGLRDQPDLKRLCDWLMAEAEASRKALNLEERDGLLSAD